MSTEVLTQKSCLEKSKKTFAFGMKENLFRAARRPPPLRRVIMVS